MPDIQITVAEKVAQLRDSARIICGNSDYTITFTFDAEWNAYTAKTARFAYCRNGVMLHQDVLFEGDTVAVPALYGIYEVAVGVYAGDIRTTTPARIPCIPCITDGDPVHEPPPKDVYDQLMEYLSKLQNGEPFAISDVTAISTGGVSADVYAIAEKEV